jgi:D-alanine-D-alanine ligase
MSQLKVAVLCGGFSSEREVSLQTGAAIERAITALGHEAVMIDVDQSLNEQLRAADVDVCYNALHGTFGEDGQIQVILDFMGLAYTGEDAKTSLVAFDKALSKYVYEAKGVSTPPYMLLDAGTDLRELPDGFEFPVFIKPTNEGSSVGVEKIKTAEALLARAHAWQINPYLMESTVTGAEVSVACIGDSVIGSVEIVPDREFYDFEAKYGDAHTQYFVPPRLSPERIAAAEAMALKAHRALGCKSLCRIDVMVNAQDVFVLETNILPGMTETSLVPKIAHAKGIEFPELVRQVLCRAQTPSNKETVQ